MRVVRLKETQKEWWVGLRMGDHGSCIHFMTIVRVQNSQIALLIKCCYNFFYMDKIQSFIKQPLYAVVFSSSWSIDISLAQFVSKKRRQKNSFLYKTSLRTSVDSIIKNNWHLQSKTCKEQTVIVALAVGVGFQQEVIIGF